MMQAHTGPLHERTADRLRARIEQSPESGIGTATSLAGEFGVSRVTMLRALRILRDEGILSFMRGQAVHLAQPSPGPVATRRDSARERIVSALESELERGTWERGDQLPKVVFLAAEHGVSKSTVSAALQVLAQGKLIHKVGKFWYIGQQTQALPRRYGVLPPVILLYATHEEQWTGLFADRELNRFVEAFNGEAESRGVQLMTVLDKPQGPENVFPAGIPSVIKVARDLGSRLLGTLVLPMSVDDTDIESLLSALAATGKPVLRLQPPDYGYVWIDNPSIVSCMYGIWGKLKYGGAVAVAWETLRSLGHQRMGMPSVAVEYDPYVDSMARIFRRDAFVDTEHLSVIRNDGRLEGMSEKQRDERIRELRSDGIPFVRELLARKFSSRDSKGLYRKLTKMEQGLVDDTPFIAPLLAAKGVSALVAANDFVARRLYFWCRAAGLRVPRDISILSFDNSNEIKSLPISSMDLGQKQLGFKAFHLLLGDLPVKTTSSFQLWGGTSLNHSGSLGTPGSRDLGTVVRGSW